MKKAIKLLSLMGVLIASSAQAETVKSVQAEDVKLEDNSLLLGEWHLYAEAPALHKEKTKVNINWNFNADGIINTWAKDSRARTGAMRINVKYLVEDGVLKKQISPGRNKKESCRVIKLEGKEMTLKCQYLYFFLTKGK